MAMEPIRPCYLSLSLYKSNLSGNRSPNNFISLNSRWRQSSEILKMPEILQILHQSPPSHHQMPPHLERDLVNVESQFNWLIDSALPSFDVTDHFQWRELDGIDELSKVTAINDQNQISKKRKLEFDVVKVKAEKQRDELEGDLKPKIDPKADYIHVRARRGQATDNHSLAERARREKIKKKMQDLQDLVPGCNKITNKAAILDEIITYVQCLQREVEFLTMKLAASTTSVGTSIHCMNSSHQTPVVVNSACQHQGRGKIRRS